MGCDFRVGDVVCDIVRGTGKVTEIWNRIFCPVVVVFEDDLDTPETYSAQGYLDPYDKKPSLYHGTWEEVFGNLPEIKPKRTKKMYLNVWITRVGEYRCNMFSTETIARVESYKDLSCNKYIKVAEEVEVEE